MGKEADVYALEMCSFTKRVEYNMQGACRLKNWAETTYPKHRMCAELAKLRDFHLTAPVIFFAIVRYMMTESAT